MLYKTGRIIILFLILITSNCLYARQGWYQLNTSLSVNYYSVHFIDSNTGIACSNGSVAKTTNGGNNWELYNTGFANRITDIKMLSKNKIVGVCDGGLIIKSTNGGVNWFSVFTSPPGFIYMINLVFPDTLNGYAVAQTNSQTGNLYRTSNGGDNWIMSYVNNPKYVSFSSPSTGWIHGSYTLGPPFNTYHMAVYKTTNSGLNWNPEYDFQTASINPGPVFFVNELTGYKVMQLGNVYIGKSNTGGSDWSNVFSTSNEVNSVYFVNANRGWFARENGKILFTSDGGTSFSEQNSSVTTNLYCVYFLNDSTGWIATSNGIILKTNTGGITKISVTADFISGNFYLSQNYPNPFNPSTRLEFRISNLGFATLKVFDALGKEVAILVNETLSPGSYEAEFNGADLPGGIYFYRLETNDISISKRMILLK